MSNPFSIRDEHQLQSLHPSEIQNTKASENADYKWLISADKIFESAIEDYKEFAPFVSMEFSITRFSLFDGQKSGDSTVCARDVKINMFPSRFCASIQENLANGKEISKIVLKRIGYISEKLETLEEKEFQKCIIQSFERKEDIVSFTFRCTNYSDSYQDFKKDGTKSGKASTKLDLSTWKVG